MVQLIQLHSLVIMRLRFGQDLVVGVVESVVESYKAIRETFSSPATLVNSLLNMWDIPKSASE